MTTIRSKVIDELSELGYPRDDVINCINDVSTRLSWHINSFCLIYSRKNKQWFRAQITNIFVHEDTNQEWIKVKYSTKSSKEIQRLNENIKPIDIDENCNKHYDRNIIKYLSNTLQTTHSRTMHLSWINIANCVHHQMNATLASTIRSIIIAQNGKPNDVNDNGKVGLYDLNEQHSQTMLNILQTKVTLSTQETNYLKTLIKRARVFAVAPIQSDDMKDMADSPDSQDFAIQIPGLNKDLLQDIFDVHRAFTFNNCHFDEYSLQQFRHDIVECGEKHLGQQFVQKHLLNLQFKEGMDFAPPYIINDDILPVVDYILGVSHYVYHLTNNVKKQQNLQFDLKLTVIPKSVVSVYDSNISFNCNVGRVDNYLCWKNIYDYHRAALRTNSSVEDIIKALHQWTVEDVVSDTVSMLHVIIDRRHLKCSKDLLFLFGSAGDGLPELNANCFVGLDFHIDFVDNKTSAYLRYGVAGQLRFYPEMLESVLPSFFKQQTETSDTTDNGNCADEWAVDLHDESFNSFYQIITGATHRSSRRSGEAKPKQSQLSIVAETFNSATNERMEYKWAEIARHNTAKDLWLVYDGKIFDITRFLRFHPGGIDVILEIAAKDQDITKAFRRLNHPPIAERIMLKHFIGVLKEEKRQKAKNKPRYSWIKPIWNADKGNLALNVFEIDAIGESADADFKILVTWSGFYSVKIDILDKQHENLMYVINNLFNRYEFADVMELSHRWNVHCKTEETLFSYYHFDDEIEREHIVDHKRMFHKIKDQITDLRIKYETEKPRYEELVKFSKMFAAMFKAHHVVHDVKYIEYLNLV